MSAARHGSANSAPRKRVKDLPVQQFVHVAGIWIWLNPQWVGYLVALFIQSEGLRARTAIFARAEDKSANRVIISPLLWRMKIFQLRFARQPSLSAEILESPP